MNEKFSPENTKKKSEKIVFQELEEAREEQIRIREEIKRILASTENSGDAKKIILETLTSKLDEAVKKVDRLTQEWVAIIDESRK